jgi:tetratricopeptide (TPR) repeat protein
MIERVAALAVLVAALLIAPAAAQAQGSKKARAHALQAKAYFDAGDYARAAEQYQAAYDLDKRPTRLYNIAVCHEKGGDRAKALDMYRRYLEADPDGAGAQVAAEAVAAIERELAAERAASAAAPDPAATADRSAEVRGEAARRAQVRVERGDELVRASMYATAAQEYIAAYEEEPSQPDHLWRAAEAYRKAGSDVKAAEQYERYLASALVLEHSLEAHLWLESFSAATDGAPTAAPPVDLHAEPERPPIVRRERALLGLAAAAVAVGLIVDLGASSSENGEFDAIDLAPVGCYALGLTLGAVWLF